MSNVIKEIRITAVEVDGYIIKPFLVIREFTKEDWFSFPGTELFENGESPLVAEFNVGVREGTLIISNEGLEISLITKHSDEVMVYSLPIKEYIPALTVAFLIRANPRREDLLDLGFKMV